MSAAAARANAIDLSRELAWLGQWIEHRFAAHFGTGAGADPAAEPALLPPAPPPVDAERSRFAARIRAADLTTRARVALALALAAHVMPRLLDAFLTRHAEGDRRVTEFGGVRGAADAPFQPTGETLAFLLGGDDLAIRFDAEAMLAAGAPLVMHGLLDPPQPPPGDDPLRSPLRVPHDALAEMTLGVHRPSAVRPGFPAQRIDTALDWGDLVLHPGTRAQLDEIEAWLAHGETLRRDPVVGRLLRPGYRALFHGPPGTGKTMTACLLGKATGRDVYRVDLSLTVSKYIGETEKNLAAVFDAAQARGWLLFFDEADALFGKRGEVRDAHDRYANQETAFLLQRIEQFDGLAILASNLRDNLDAAFSRRFESIVTFPLPRAEERAALWRRALPATVAHAPDLDLDAIARDHALSGGAIVNAAAFAALEALRRDAPIGRSQLVHAVRREYAKEGRNP